MRNNILQTPEERTASVQKLQRKLRVAKIWLLAFCLLVLCFNIALKISGESKDYRLIAGTLGTIILVSAMLSRSAWLTWTLMGICGVINATLITTFFWH